VTREDSETVFATIRHNRGEGHAVVVFLHGLQQGIEVREVRAGWDGPLADVEDIHGDVWSIDPARIVAVRYHRAP
jgi:hypothetical protein